MSNLENIVKTVKSSVDHQLSKKALKEKVLIDLHVTYGGGIFKITPDLISFLATWPNDVLYLEDVYETPIEIQRVEFLTICTEQYQKVMNRWHNEYSVIKNARKI